jgi:hypothetical protein
VNNSTLGSAAALVCTIIVGCSDASVSNEQATIAEAKPKRPALEIPGGPKWKQRETSPPSRLLVGTNLTYLAPGWTGEKVWIDDVPADPWTHGEDPWNPEFVEEIAMYDVIRPMQWNAVNPLDTGPKITTWAQRRQPDDPSNFSDVGVGTGTGPGLAFEWQVDLANKLGADLWLNVPIWVDDQFFVELASLIHDELDPGRRVYVELCNEVWNYAPERNYAAAQGAAAGVAIPGREDDTFGTALRWQAYRSSQMWAAFESVWGTDAERVVNVLAGWSTNPWATENYHLAPLFEEEGFNPTSSYPEAYAIAPYFGGNNLDGARPDIFDMLRVDLFEHRWFDPSLPSRLDDVIHQHQVVVDSYGLELVGYEGGQHLGTGAAAPNRDPRMYDVYMEYLQAIAPYFTVFVHFTNVAPSKEARSFGTKEYTGQPDEEAPKYRALQDFIGAL